MAATGDPITALDPLRALEHPERRGRLDVGTRSVVWRLWEPLTGPGNRLVVLVHGGGGHSGWWDVVGPALTRVGASVVALDLSGHGESDDAAPYSFASWLAEILAVADLHRHGRNVVLVGHSMGGVVVLRVALARPDWVDGVVVVEAAVRAYDEAELAPYRAIAARPAAVLPSEAAARGRVRLLPEVRPWHPRLLELVQARGVRRVDDGWTVRLDRAALVIDDMGPDQVQALDVPLGIVRAERGTMTPDIADLVARRAGQADAPVRVVADAGHHCTVDQPAATAAAIAAVLPSRSAPATAGKSRSRRTT